MQQSDKNASDINLIVKRYCECGICPTCSIKEPLSDEVIAMSADDFNTMMQKQAQISTAFNELPAELRQKFGHNPANMLEFMANPNNKEECVKLGLFKSDICSGSDMVRPNDIVMDMGSTKVEQGDTQSSSKVEDNPTS